MEIHLNANSFYNKNLIGTISYCCLGKKKEVIKKTQLKSNPYPSQLKINIKPTYH